MLSPCLLSLPAHMAVAHRRPPYRSRPTTAGSLTVLKPPRFSRPPAPYVFFKTNLAQTRRVMVRLVAALAIAVFSAPSLIGAACVEQAKLDKYAKSYADCVASTSNYTGVNLTLSQCLCADRFRVRRCLR
jgi:hypothetical protein